MSDPPSDWTPLHCAVWNLDYNQVKSLLRSTCINQADDQGWTALHFACASEDGYLFRSHQVERRRCSLMSPGCKKYTKAKWRQGVTMRQDRRSGEDERITSLAILEILLQHGADVNVRAQDFCTPLHCAANSGWLSHAHTLVQAGANVYTGPRCSPLCWTKSGSGSSHLVAIYLRVELGDAGLTRIEQDHASQLQSPCNNRFPRGEKPLFKTQAHHRLNRHGHCSVCSEMSLEELVTPTGYKHLSFQDLRRGATRCKLCSVILSLLTEGPEQSFNERSQVIIRASTNSYLYEMKDRSAAPVCSLEIKLSAGCTCSYSYAPRDPEPSPDFSNCRGNCRVLRESATAMFTDQDMSNSTHIIRRGSQLEKSPISNSTIATIGRWLKECADNHPGCKSSDVSSKFSNGEPPLPTRLIQLHGGQGSHIRIVDAADNFGRYAALSHRWVSGRPDWITRQETLGNRQSWFSVQSLPASIVDAVEITRRLGIDYLWVDSICIIQDSDKDWNYEASKMASVYANAYFTIFADQARDDNHGFLHPRQVFPVTSFDIRTENNATVAAYLRGSSPDSYKIEKHPVFASDTIDSSYLRKRGWILQERVLSPKRLHFGAHQVYWVCRKNAVAENGHPVNHWADGWMVDIHRLMESESTSRYEFHKTWAKLVENYCTLKLTQGEDKLPALAGVAQMFWQKSKDEYIAGLWRQTLAAGLAWSVKETDLDKLPRRLSTYRAPSFSWACVDEEISMQKFEYAGGEEDFNTSDLTVITSRMEFEGEDRFGKLKGGTIIVSGLVRQVVNLGPITRLMNGYKGYNPLYDMGMTPIGSFRKDSKDDINYSEVTCLRLFGGRTEYFLVLTPVAPADQACTTYRRIGLGSNMLSVRQWDDARFFDGAERKIISLV